MNVVSVITGFVRPTVSEGDASRNVPTNHQSVPSQNPSTRPQLPAPPPREFVKQGEERNPKVSQKDFASGGGTTSGGSQEDPMHSQFVLQQSSFRRQSGDAKPWARYL
jgi:hypothetical protein